MLKKLRLRLTVIIALLIIGLIAAVFVTIMLMMHMTAVSTAFETLKAAASVGGISTPDLNGVFWDGSEFKPSADTSSDTGVETQDDDSGGHTGEGDIPPEKLPEGYDKHSKRFLSETITIKYNTEGVIFDVVSTVSADTDLGALNSGSLPGLIESGEASGTVELNGVSYRYLKQENANGGLIVLLSREEEIYTAQRMFNAFLIILLPAAVVAAGIGRLIASVTVKPIAQAWNRQKCFIADASHELKTPLTIIAANLDVVQSDGSQTVAQQSKWLGYIRSETQRMKKLTEELLYLAKLDASAENTRGSSPERVVFSLSDTITDVCLPFEPVVYEAGRRFTFNIEPDIDFYGVPDELKQTCVILLDNALKNSREGTEIIFTLERVQRGKGKGEARVVCSDEGAFIPEELRSKIFERFFRADGSRASNTGGSGLGLAIASEIVTRCGGSISADSVESGLTTFTVLLPLK